MDRHPQIFGERFRYKFGGGGSSKRPILPAPAATPSTLTSQAQQAGTKERKRLLRRRGRAGTIFAGRRDLQPARVSAAELKQTL